MNFTHYDLGQREKGESVEITLDNAANVQLMDSSNFSNYQNGGRYRYIGGLMERPHIILQIPYAGCWHIVVDLRGLKGSVKSSIKI